MNDNFRSLRKIVIDTLHPHSGVTRDELLRILFLNFDDAVAALEREDLIEIIPDDLGEFHLDIFRLKQLQRPAA